MKTQRMKIIDYEGSEDENLEDRDGKVGLTHLQEDQALIWEMK